MNPKKLLEILGILCPVFNKVETKDGSPDQTTPSGYAVWFAARVGGMFKAIWDDNEIMNDVDKFIMFFARVFLSIVILPITIIMWVIGNLIFSIKYDKRNHKHLFAWYSFVTALVILLGVMVMDYKCEGRIQDDVNSYINDVIDEQTERGIVRKANTSEDIPEVTTVTTESDPVETEIQEEPVITEVHSETIECDGYTLQRKSRDNQ